MLRFSRIGQQSNLKTMNKSSLGFLILACGIVAGLCFGRLTQNNSSREDNKDRIEDKMMITAFSANVVGEIGTISSVLASTNGVSQVRVSYGSKGHENYALATMPVTQGQRVKVIGVTARHSEAPGVLPSFTRLVLPY